MPMNPRLLRPMASGFNPRSIPGLKLWLNAANTASLTFNGSTVSQVNDLSGNGFHATQTTANNQPTYQATGFNGRPTLYFDANDWAGAPATIADIFQTPTTSPQFAVFMACYMPTLANAGNIGFGSTNLTSGSRLFFQSNFGSGGNVFFDVVNVTTGRVSVSGQSEAATTTPHIMSAYRFGALMAFRRNASQVVGRADASGNYTSTTPTLIIGKSATTEVSAMYLSEMLIYAATLTLSQVAAIERGLARKWGVTL